MPKSSTACRPRSARVRLPRRSRSARAERPRACSLIARRASNFLAHEKRQDEIVRTEIGLAHEVAQGRGAPQAARTMNQFPSPAEAKRAGSGSKRWGGSRLGAAFSSYPAAKTARIRSCNRMLPAEPAQFVDAGPSPLRRLGMTAFRARPRVAPVGPGAAAVFVALVMPRLAPYKKANYLLIDISNSFTKLAFASRERLGGTERIETARLSESAITSFIRQPARGAWLSSAPSCKEGCTYSSRRGRRLAFLS